MNDRQSRLLVNLAVRAAATQLQVGQQRLDTFDAKIRWQAFFGKIATTFRLVLTGADCGPSKRKNAKRRLRRAYLTNMTTNAVVRWL